MAFPLYKCSMAIAAGQKVGTPSGIYLVATHAALPSEILDADGAKPAQNGGGDLRAYSDSNLTTQIPLDVITFTTDNNPSNGRAQLAVKLSSLVSDTFWLAWGSDEGAKSQPAAGDTYGRYNVYPSGWHSWPLEENPGGSAPQWLDRTSNQRHWTTAGSMDSSDLVTGKVGNAIDFDGVNDEASITSSTLSQFISASQGSLVCWMKPQDGQNTNPRYHGVRFGDFSGFAGLGFGSLSGINRVFAYNWDGTEDYVLSTFTANAWTMLGWVHTGGNLYLYKDGSLVGSTPSGNTQDVSHPLKLAHTHTSYPFHASQLDSPRTFTGALTADDFGTLYNAENDNAAFWDTGGVEDVSTGTAMIFESVVFSSTLLRSGVVS